MESAPTKDQQEHVDRSIAARLTPRLAEKFCAVPDYFLKNYYRLRPHPNARGLNSTEAMVIIHILSYKWDARAPFPAIKTLAERMGLQIRAVRTALKSLQDLGLVRREAMPHGGTNRYHLDGLFNALERLMDADAVTADGVPAPASSAGAALTAEQVMEGLGGASDASADVLEALGRPATAAEEIAALLGGTSKHGRSLFDTISEAA